MNILKKPKEIHEQRNQPEKHKSGITDNLSWQTNFTKKEHNYFSKLTHHIRYSFIHL